jgi:hypothetical protein
MPAPIHPGASLKVEVFRILSQLIRHILGKLNGLGEYTPDVLLNGLFVGWQKRGHGEAFFVVLFVFFRPAR